MSFSLFLTADQRYLLLLRWNSAPGHPADDMSVSSRDGRGGADVFTVFYCGVQRSCKQCVSLIKVGRYCRWNSELFRCEDDAHYYTPYWTGMVVASAPDANPRSYYNYVNASEMCPSFEFSRVIFAGSPRREIFAQPRQPGESLRIPFQQAFFFVIRLRHLVPSQMALLAQNVPTNQADILSAEKTFRAGLQGTSCSVRPGPQPQLAASPSNQNTSSGQAQPTYAQHAEYLRDELSGQSAEASCASGASCALVVCGPWRFQPDSVWEQRALGIIRVPPSAIHSPLTVQFSFTAPDVAATKPIDARDTFLCLL